MKLIIVWEDAENAIDLSISDMPSMRRREPGDEVLVELHSVLKKDYDKFLEVLRNLRVIPEYRCRAFIKTILPTCEANTVMLFKSKFEFFAFWKHVTAYDYSVDILCQFEKPFCVLTEGEYYGPFYVHECDVYQEIAL